MNDNTENKIDNINNTEGKNSMENKVTDGISVGNKTEDSMEIKADRSDKDNTAFDDKEVILEKNIGDLLKDREITTKEYIGLWRAGIITVRDITEQSERDLLAIFNFAEKSCNNIIEILKKYGLTLKEGEKHSASTGFVYDISKSFGRNTEKVNNEKNVIVAAKKKVSDKEASNEREETYDKRLSGEREEFYNKEVVLNKSVDEVGFTVRTYNRLKRADIKTVRDIFRRDKFTLLCNLSFDEGCVAEIVDVMEKYGLILKETPLDDVNVKKAGLNTVDDCLRYGGNALRVVIENGHLTSDVVSYDRKAILNKTIKELLIDGEISTRESNCLSGIGVNTLGGITEMGMFDLLRIGGFGTKSMERVMNVLHKYGLTLKDEGTAADNLGCSENKIDESDDNAYPTEIFRYLNTELDNRLSDIRWEIANMEKNSFEGKDWKETRQGGEYDKKREQLFRLKMLDGLVINVAQTSDESIIKVPVRVVEGVSPEEMKKKEEALEGVESKDTDEPFERLVLCKTENAEISNGEKLAADGCKILRILLKNVTDDFIKVKLSDLYFVDMLGHRIELERNSQSWFDEEYIAPRSERRIYVTAGKELDYKFYWHIMIVVETKEKKAEGKTVTKERVYKIEHDEEQGGFYVDDYFEREI